MLYLDYFSFEMQHLKKKKKLMGISTVTKKCIE